MLCYKRFIHNNIEDGWNSKNQQRDAAKLTIIIISTFPYSLTTTSN